MTPETRFIESIPGRIAKAVKLQRSRGRMTPETLIEAFKHAMPFFQLQRSRGRMTPETALGCRFARAGGFASTEPGPDDPGDPPPVKPPPKDRRLQRSRGRMTPETRRPDGHPRSRAPRFNGAGAG